jgi:hypothetical protein
VLASETAVTTAVSDATVGEAVEIVSDTVTVAVSIVVWMEVTVGVSGVLVGVVAGSTDCVGVGVDDGVEVSEAEVDCGVKSVEGELEALSLLD